MTLQPHILNDATFVGIDCHPDSHTAFAMNRFKECKGHMTAANTLAGIGKLVQWLKDIDKRSDYTIVGFEGGGTARNALVRAILSEYKLLFEVNPLYTKHKRSFGTRGDKTDIDDAKLIAGILTTELEELPIITPEQLTPELLCLKKTVWFYDEATMQGTRLQNQLHKLDRERALAKDPQELRVLADIIKTRNRELAFTRNMKRNGERQIKVLFARGTCPGLNLAGMLGVGIVTAARIVAHTSCIGRFPNRNAYVRYAGIAPLARSSGRTTRFVNTTRGNRKLNSVLYYAVLNRIVWDKQVQDHYREKIASGKTKKEAILCLMRKTAILVYSLLKSGEEFRAEV